LDSKETKEFLLEILLLFLHFSAESSDVVPQQRYLFVLAVKVFLHVLDVFLGRDDIRMLATSEKDTLAVPERGATDGAARLDIVKLVLKNMLRKRKGAAATEKAKHFMEGLRILGGESVFNYVSENLGLHDERTSRSVRRHRRHKLAGPP
jgi:hypothetical protein